MPSSEAVTGYDYAAWTRPNAPEALKARIAEAKAQRLQPAPEGTGQADVKNRFIIGVAGTALFSGGVLLAWAYYMHGGGTVAIVEGAISAAFVVFGAVLIAIAAPGFANRWGNYFRACDFAEGNGFEFTVQRDAPALDAMVFTSQAFERSSVFVYSRRAEPAVEVGVLWRLARGAGDDKRTIERGYIVIQLPAWTPGRVVLRSDAPRNERVINTPWARSLGREVEYGKEFTLYCEPAAEGFARGVFTSQLVAKLGELEQRFAPVNVELCDDRLVVFSAKPFNLVKAKDVRLVFDTVAAALHTAGTAQ